MHALSCDVAVIGAGLAGLAAGDFLKSQGCNVIIIEAENRVGGKVFTHHVSHDTHFELGPFSFGDGEQPLWDYVHRFALPIIEHTQIERLFCFKGYTGTFHEKGHFLRDQEQKIPLNQLWNYLQLEFRKN